MRAGRFLTAVMTVFALLVVPMAAYVAGYYRLATLSDVTPVSAINSRRLVIRLYPQHWQANIFKPAASVEAWLTDSDVEILCSLEIDR